LHREVVSVGAATYVALISSAVPDTIKQISTLTFVTTEGQ